MTPATSRVAPNTGDDAEGAARKASRFAELAFVTALQQLRVDLLALGALVVALAADGADDDGEATSTHAMTAFSGLMQFGQGKRDAWGQFCAAVGVHPDALVAPHLEDIEWVKDLLRSAADALGGDGADQSPIPSDIARGELATLVALWNDAKSSLQPNEPDGLSS